MQGTSFVDESTIDFPIFLLFFWDKVSYFSYFLNPEFPTFLFFWATMALDTLPVALPGGLVTKDDGLCSREYLWVFFRHNGRGELDKVSIFILTTLILMNRSIQAMTLKKISFCKWKPERLRKTKRSHWVHSLWKFTIKFRKCRASNDNGKHHAINFESLLHKV